MLTFRQLFDSASSTYTYLLGDAGQAVLIDPVFEHARRDLALLRELGLELVATLDTHVHADHVTGAAALKASLPEGPPTAVGMACEAAGYDRPLLDGDELPYVYEALPGRPLQVVPSQAVILGWQPFWQDHPALAIDCIYSLNCRANSLALASAPRKSKSPMNCRADSLAFPNPCTMALRNSSSPPLVTNPRACAVNASISRVSGASSGSTSVRRARSSVAVKRSQAPARLAPILVATSSAAPPALSSCAT